MSDPVQPPRRFMVTHLFGVHYDGNDRYEGGKPVIVDAATAARLQKEKVSFTSFDPDGRGTAELKPRFAIEEYTELEKSEEELAAEVTAALAAEKDKQRASAAPGTLTRNRLGTNTPEPV